MKEKNFKDHNALEPVEITSPRTATEPGPKPTPVDSCCGPSDNGDISRTDQTADNNIAIYSPTIISLILLLSGIALDFFNVEWFTGAVRPALFGIAYLLVGGKVLLYAARNIVKGEVFNEFFLMGIATLGAFYIGEYAEGVAVMLFYVIGEHFQEGAVKRSRRSIKDLIDNRPDIVNVLRHGKFVAVDPQSVDKGEIMQVKAGEKVALDGKLLTDSSSFDTAALTGESRPDTRRKGEKVLAGMVNQNKVVQIEVTSGYQDSALSRILLLVEEAAGRKAKTQRFITRFAKVYTPIVVFLAIALVVIPYFLTPDYVFNDWLYRSLVFLVISCPCALVISIPLGYFGGIGAASKNGVLFKGSNFLDLMTKVDTLVLDKTGTLTKGVFNVQQAEPEGNITKGQLVALAAALESQSTHPIGKAIVEFAGEQYGDLKVSKVEEIAGHGLRGLVDGVEVLVGNSRLLQKFNIAHDPELNSAANTVILVAVDGKYAGRFIIADEVKNDAVEAIRSLRALGIKELVMLSGDKTSVVNAIAAKLSIDKAFGDLLPEEKVKKVEQFQKEGKTVAFVGDGINDAPVITVADVGMAMGALGSDAAIETADVVIQTDQPSKIATAINIGKKTKQVVWQNIGMAFGVKAIVLTLAALGMASLWEAVFADVGVALLAILNAVRIQRIRF